MSRLPFGKGNDAVNVNDFGGGGGQETAGIPDQIGQALALYHFESFGAPDCALDPDTTPAVGNEDGVAFLKEIVLVATGAHQVLIKVQVGNYLSAPHQSNAAE